MLEGFSSAFGGICKRPYLSLVAMSLLAASIEALIYSYFMLPPSSNFPSKWPVSSSISMVFSSPSIMANQTGMIMKDAKIKGPKMVMIMKDFLRTRVRYSRFTISRILCIDCLLSVYHGNKYFVHIWNFFFEELHFYLIHYLLEQEIGRNIRKLYD